MASRAGATCHPPTQLYTVVRKNCQRVRVSYELEKAGSFRAHLLDLLTSTHDDVGDLACLVHHAVRALVRVDTARPAVQGLDVFERGVVGADLGGDHHEPSDEM